MKPTTIFTTALILIAFCVAPISAASDWAWCADQDIFFWNASSDISGYRVMDHRPQIDIQREVVSSPITASSGEVILGTWATPMGSPGVSELGPGLFRFRTYAFASSSSGKTTMKFYIINRSSTGAETALFFGNAITRDIDQTTVPTEYLTSYARRNYTTMFPGDRLVIRINASTDSASPRTVTMDVAGNTNASMVSVSYFLCDESKSTDGMEMVGLPVAICAGFIGALIIDRRRRSN